MLTLLTILFSAIALGWAQHCPPLLPVANGQFKYGRENEIFHTEGSTATLVCDPGATLSGHTNSFRCHSGQWNPPVDAKCLALRAEPVTLINVGQSFASCHPLNIANGNAVYSALGAGPFPEGTNVHLWCDFGYAPMGKAFARCENGQWTNIGQCKSISNIRCAPLLPVPNGQISYIASGNGPYDYGAIAQLNCNLGYTAVGVSAVTCEPTGWGPFPGLGSCQKPSQEDRSRRQSGLGGSSGQCPSISDPHGVVTFLGGNLGLSAQQPAGASAIVSCHFGYTGGGTSSCRGGTWSPTIPPCVSGNNPNGLGAMAMPGSTDCPAMFFVFNGNIQYNQQMNIFSYPQGTTAMLQCNPNYVVSGQSQATCQNGHWEPPSLGTCNLQGMSGGGIPGMGAPQCPALMVTNAMVTYSQQGLTYPQGTTATVNCNQGFQLSGTQQTTCQNGLWSPQAGQCMSSGMSGLPGTSTGGMQCFFPMAAPFGGTVRHDRGEVAPFPEGTVATASCNSGQLQGSNTATCRGGVWSPAMFPACSMGGTGVGVPGGSSTTSCPFGMMQPFGANLTYSTGPQMPPYNQGTTVTMSCNNGRPVQGQATATCLGGVWSPNVLGTCDMFPGTSVGGSPNPGTNPCYFGIFVVGGTVDYAGGATVAPFPQNTQGNLRCNQGYTLQGPSQSTCQNGAWTPQIGTCVLNGMGGTPGVGIGTGTTESHCFTLPTVNGGRINYFPDSMNGRYSEGTTASLVCDAGWTAVSSRTARCNAQGWSDMTVGQCQQMTGGNPSCQFVPSNPQNGRLQVHAVNPQPPYPHLTAATVLCNPGFFPSNPTATSLSCQNGQWIPSQISQCISSGSTLGSQCFGGLPLVVGGRIQYSNGATVGPFPIGTSAQLLCDQPGMLRGIQSSQCANGVWTPSQLGTCSAQLYNPPASTSSQSGTAKAPQCLLVNQIIPHGVIEYSDRYNPTGPFPEETTATLSCLFGFVAAGSPKAVCQGGSWQPRQLGECRLNAASIVATGCPPMQVKLADGYLDTDRIPENGIFPAGATTTLQCKAGFRPVGNTKSSCQASQWQPGLGSCEKTPDLGTAVQSCQPLIPPLNGRISYIQASQRRNYELGTTAILNCELGYIVDGQAALSCTSTGWHPQPGFGQCRLNNEIFGR
uniref:Sushi domain-containing protein n=1 Tax=Steinernema glaseri TaxID=37863 RepID=A0A1I7ZLD9_9BILA